MYRRRNGKPQSCEPCRKWKIRCDHAHPVCQRCEDRKITEQCFYHPAPMTSSSGRKRIPKAKKSETASESLSPGVSKLGGRHRPGIRAVEGPLLRSDPASSRENTISAAIGDKLGTASPQEILSGVRVLQLLHQNRDIDILVRKSYQRSRVPLLPHAVIEAILHSTRDLLDQAPEEAGPGLDVYLTELTAHIFENSAKPLVAHPSTTVDEYVALFTGDHLRWEAVGNLFAVASRALTATPANDTLFSGGSNRLPDRSTLILQMAEASDCCLILCARVSSANELLVALQVNDVMLKTQQYGDSSYQAWRRLGDLCATVYYTGLHKQSADDDKDVSGYPAFLAQWKLGCFAAAFYVDKCLATFLGRPPLLNYRHCKPVLPLDLSDDTLVADAASFAEAARQLGGDGWNARGEIHRASLVRIRLLLAIFRDKVLELTAASYDGDILMRAIQVLDEARIAWEHCPAALRYDCFHPVESEEYQFNNANTITIITTYLDYLHSQFLLLQYLARYGDESYRAAFLETAGKILATVVRKITTSSAPSIDLSRDHSWINLYYGLPSAMLLAQQLHNTRPPRETTGAGPSPSQPPTAATIRNLCVFLSNLSWVVSPSSHGDYQMCRDAEQRLSELVDRILNRIPTTTTDAMSPPQEQLDDCLFPELIDYGNLDFGSGIFD